VIHFEIHAERPQRAIDFYSKLLGWKFQQWGGQEYWLITTGPKSELGIDGGLIKRRGTIDGEAVIAYVCTVEVAAVDESVKKAVSLGGKNVVSKMAIPGAGWLAYCKDPEGNIFGLMQSDATAA